MMKRKLFEKRAESYGFKVARAIRDFGREVYDPYPYRRYMRSRGCIFIHIPKNAGTSILNLMGARGGRDHCTYRDFKKANPTRFERYFKFTVVRDPVERFLSTYAYIANMGNGQHDTLLAEKVNSNCRNVSEFAEFVEKEKLILKWPVMWPQSIYIADTMGNIQMDELLRIERLEEDFSKKIAPVLGLKSSLPRVNVSSSKDILNGMSKDEKSKIDNKVRELYSIDYEVIKF